MADVKIIKITSSGGPFGTEVIVEGVHVPRVRSIHFEANAGEVPVLHDGLDIEGEAFVDQMAATLEATAPDDTASADSPGDNVG